MNPENNNSPARIQLRDNYNYNEDERCDHKLTPEQRIVLREYSGKTVSELAKENSNLIVFPLTANGKNDDEVDEHPLFTFTERDGGKNCYFKTGNLVGFFGIGDLMFEIGSRFDYDKYTKRTSHHFFFYMLQQVFFPTVVDLKTKQGLWEDLIDILPYLFPAYLARAFRQGIFRQYRYFEFNDDRLRGTVNIPEHIRKNIPFMGKIAYRTREYTSNNSLMHLIRHTIELIRRKGETSNILCSDPDIRKCVNQVIEFTPDYSPRNLRKVMSQNLRPNRHPFYTEYDPLRRLCFRILRREQADYNESQDQVYGILFDAAWLWEEYLATLMPTWIKHPRNKAREGALNIYKSGSSENRIVYPDFYSAEGKIVLDAKYQHLNDMIGDHYSQLMCYMYVLKSDYGVLIYPSREENKGTDYHEKGVFNGYGGAVGTINLKIPQNAESFGKFEKEIQKSQNVLKRKLERWNPIPE